MSPYLQSKDVPFWGGQVLFRDIPGGYAWLLGYLLFDGVSIF
jgi:hypothetical protein